MAPVPDRLRALSETLVKIASPTGDCDTLLVRLEKFLSAARIPTDRLTGPGFAPVLVAGHPPDPRRPTVLWATHADTVPPGEEPSHPAGEVAGGKMYGRGALDMKGGLAISLLLLEEFRDDPRFNLGLVVTTDEEAESAGAWEVLRHLPQDPSVVLVPEPTWERCAVSANGRIVWQVSVRGTGGHGEELRATKAPPNPVLAMSRFVGSLPGDFVPLSIHSEAEGEVTLPRRVRVRLDHALPPGRDSAADRDELLRLTRGGSRADSSLRWDVEPAPRTTPWLPAFEGDPKDAWVQRFLRAAKVELGRVRRFHMPAVGDFNVFGSRAPTVVFGPSGEGAHADDEWVDLGSLERCHAVYRRFLLEFPQEAAPGGGNGSPGEDPPPRTASDVAKG